MELIVIEGNQRCPDVNFNHKTGIIEFKGRSIMDNPLAFYTSLFEWLEEYKREPQPFTEVNIKFEYFNTASSKCLMNIFRHLTEMINSGNKVDINWFFSSDDDDMKEVGEDFQSMFKTTFNILELTR